MKSARNYLILVLGLATLAGTALAWKQHQELIQLRAQLLNPDERMDLEKLLADARKSVRDLQDQLAALRGRIETSRPEAAVANDNRGRRGPGGRAVWEALSNDPKFQKLIAIQRKAGLDVHYAALFKALNLTPQQLDQFKSLLVERQQAIQDAMNAAREQGINPRSDPAAFQQAITDAESSIDAQLQSTLGPGDFAQLQQFEQTIPGQNTVAQVQQALTLTDPLNSSQANALVNIIMSNAPQRAGNGTAGIGGGGAFGGFGGNGNQTIPITDADYQQALASGQFDSAQLGEIQQQAAAQQAAAAARQAAAAAARQAAQQQAAP
jgi:hypothetical protein